MQTSYFKHPDLDPTDPRLVSIARWVPHWYRHHGGRSYYPLAVPKHMKDMDEGEFRQAYLEEILDFLDPTTVAAELGEISILLCWEPPGEFCHRRLVAEWLEKELGIQVPEYEAPATQGKLF